MENSAVCANVVRGTLDHPPPLPAYILTAMNSQLFLWIISKLSSNYETTDKIRFSRMNLLPQNEVTLEDIFTLIILMLSLKSLKKFKIEKFLDNICNV